MNYLFYAGRRKIIILMIVMGFLSCVFSGLVTYQMYVKQKKQQVIFLTYVSNTVKSMIGFIIADEFNRNRRLIRENVFKQIRYHMKLNGKATKGLGQTGEVAAGYLEGDNINFILDLRFSKEDGLSGQKKLSKTNEPMRQALSGKSGNMIGYDYRGKEVLAVFDFMPQLNLGIVAKIDVSEIQKPYLLSAGYSFLLVVFLFSLTAMIVIRTGERVITENEIREQKYRAYIAYAPIGIILCDKEGHFREVNDKASEIIGHDRETLLTSSFSEIMPDKTIKVNMGERVISEMVQFFNADHKFINNRKEEFFLMINVVRLTHERYLVFITDITARKEVENRLAESEERLSITLETSNIGIWDWQIKSNAWYASPTYFTMLGYVPIAGPTNRNLWLEQAHPEDRTIITDTIANVLQGKSNAYRYEARIRHFDETYRWVSVLGKVVERDLQGNPVRMLGTRIDITEQKRMQNELMESEEKFRTLFESSNDAIMLMDEGGLMDCNLRTLQTLAVFSKKDVIHKYLYHFSPVTQPDGQYSKNLVNEYIATAYQSGNSHFEWRILRADGTEFPAEVLLTSIHLNGKPMLQATVRDITQRKLMEDQLLQSSKMATLGEMATGIAHEINQPLSVIRMGAQLMERAIKANNLSNDFLLDQADKFIRNIDRATKVINHLRLFGRKVSDQLVPISILIPIKNAIEMVDNRLHNSTIQLNQYLDNNLPEVLGEESSMEQVFINILLNAIDALMTLDGNQKKEITIRAKYHLEEGMVVTSISNNGPEIPKSIIDKIFDPFFTTKAPGHGTGLGLSISYGILKSSGGSISVENTGNGPNFTIKIPAKEAE